MGVPGQQGYNPNAPRNQGQTVTQDAPANNPEQVTVTTNAVTQRIWSKRNKNLEASTYVGEKGKIWYDELTGILRLGDGVTPGGRVIGGGGGGSPGGPNGSIQFNNNGVLDGSANVTYDSANAILVSNAISFTNELYIGNTLFVRTLTVGTNSSTPVTVPLATNNSFNVLDVNGGNITVYTT